MRWRVVWGVASCMTVFARSEAHAQPRGLRVEVRTVVDQGPAEPVGQGRLVSEVFAVTGEGGAYTLERMATDATIVNSLPLPKTKPALTAPRTYHEAEFADKSRRYGSYPLREGALPAFDPLGFWWTAGDHSYRLA